MGYRNNPKREKQIEKARQQAIAENAPFLDPGILYGRASADDIEYYSAEMLAASAAHSFEALSRWTGDAPLISIAQVEGVTPREIPVTVLTIIGRNMPFLYDSVMGEVTSSYRGLYLAVHPILVRDEKAQAGYRLAEPDDEPSENISLIQLHIAPLAPQAATALEDRLRFVLTQVQSAYRDWRPMLAKLDEALDELSKRGSSRRKTERAEAVEFLNWLRNDNFTFLGMRDYTYSGKGKNAKIERGDGVGLGSLSDPDVRVLRLGKNAVTTTPEILAFLDGPDFLIVTKANVKSIVHRRAYMDYIGIKRFDEDGNVIGELRIVGLFTATAYTRSWVFNSFRTALMGFVLLQIRLLYFQTENVMSNKSNANLNQRC